MFSFTAAGRRSSRLLRGLVTAGLVACGSDKGGDSGIDHPIVGSWRLTAEEERLVSETEFRASEPSCRIDGVWTFRAAGDWELSTLCENGAPPLTGGWSLDSSETTLVITYSDAPGDYQYQIASVDGAALVLQYNTGEVPEDRIIRSTYARVE